MHDNEPFSQYDRLLQARRIGGVAFLIANFIVVALILLGLSLSIYIVHLSDIQINPNPQPFAVLAREKGKFIVPFAISAGVYLYLCWWTGKGAGAAILVRKSPFFWTGPLYMMLPTLAWSGIAVFLIDFVFQFAGRKLEIYEDIVLPFVIISLAVYVPAALAGFLAGLVVYRKGRKI